MHKPIHAQSLQIFTFCSIRRCGVLTLQACLPHIIFFIIATGYVSGAWAAEPVRGVDTARCKNALATIMRTTSASLDHPSPSGDNMFLKHQVTHEFVLSCASYQQSVSASISYHGAFPPSSYFDLVADVSAAITGDSAQTLRPIVIRCQVDALKSDDLTADEVSEHGEVECTSLTIDGGGTLIDVRLKPAPTGPDD